VVSGDGKVTCWGRNVDKQCNMPGDLEAMICGSILL
jgi:hypothetical protein